MALVDQPWVAIGLVLAAFLALFLTLAAIARGSRVAPEVSRKLFHVGSGLLTLSFPFLFRELWPVLLLTGASAVLLISVRHLPCCARIWGTSLIGWIARRAVICTFRSRSWRSSGSRN
jgi:phytol kinase